MLVEKRWAAWPIYVLWMLHKNYCWLWLWLWLWVSAAGEKKTASTTENESLRIVMWTMAMGSFTLCTDVAASAASMAPDAFKFLFALLFPTLCNFFSFHFRLFSKNECDVCTMWRLVCSAHQDMYAETNYSRIMWCAGDALHSVCHSYKFAGTLHSNDMIVAQFRDSLAHREVLSQKPICGSQRFLMSR